MFYQCGQKGHYAKSCPQKRLSPVAPVPSSVPSKVEGCNQVQQCQMVCTRQTMKAQDPGPPTSPARTSGDETHLISGNCSKQGAQNDQDQQQVMPVCSDRTKHEQSKKGPKECLQGRVHHVSAETIWDESSVILGMLLANSFPASVLIDPRATHSFISTQFCC